MMKAITWLASVTVGVAALSAPAFAARPEGWGNDLAKAFKQAAAEKKAVLVEFTGSDWCPPCIYIDKNVFSKKEFITEASKKYVLVEIDFPQGDTALAEKNQPLALKYGIEGFPTTILLSSDGKEFARFNPTEYPTPTELLKHLEAALEKKELD